MLCHLARPVTHSAYLKCFCNLTLQHSGFLHIALGCWALLLFGPRVCRAYGQMTFFLIYILGGICGNLSSFVHTPEITVCGTVSCLPPSDIILDEKNAHIIALLFSFITLI